MATERSALSTDRTAASPTEPAPATERARRSDRRIPTARETLATLPEADVQAVSFEPHDTIPAPPWLGDPEEGELEPQPSATSP
jgi:hypothetical protein